MKKTLLILGGGENQIPLIKKTKQLGHKIVLCDYLPENPGKQYSDVYYMISTRDYEAILGVAKMENVDGIVTNSEPVLHVMAKLTDELKLPSVTEEKISLFLDKELMRNHLEKCGINTVQYKACENIDQAIEYYHTLDCKMVMKPTDCSASRGVYTVNKEADIRNYFDKSQRLNRRGHVVLLEKYVEGCEFSVDGICIAGKHYSLGVSKKIHYFTNENLDKELYFSYWDNEYDYDFLRKYNNRIVESTGLSFGMTHAEYKFENGRFHFIEMAARGGGMFISTEIIPYISGIDTIKVLIESSLGENQRELIEIEERFKKRCAVLKFFSTPNERSGVVRYMSGLDRLKQKGILKYSLDCKAGDFVEIASDGTNRLGYYIAVAETEARLAEIIRDVDENVVIRF